MPIYYIVDIDVYVSTKMARNLQGKRIYELKISSKNIESRLLSYEILTSHFQLFPISIISYVIISYTPDN